MRYILIVAVLLSGCGIQRAIESKFNKRAKKIQDRIDQISLDLTKDAFEIEAIQRIAWPPINYINGIGFTDDPCADSAYGCCAQDKILIQRFVKDMQDYPYQAAVYQVLARCMYGLDYVDEPIAIMNKYIPTDNQDWVDKWNDAEYGLFNRCFDKVKIRAIENVKLPGIDALPTQDKIRDEINKLKSEKNDAKPN